MRVPEIYSAVAARRGHAIFKSWDLGGAAWVIGATVHGNDRWCSHRILISSRESEVPLSKFDSWSFLGSCLLACFVCVCLFVFKEACKVVQARPGLTL